MREGWTYKMFEDCLVKAAKAKQVQASEYNAGSKYPIVSQEDKMVSGYCDDSSFLYHIDKPVVIFGDHTRVLKYVDFDFVVGADGVKILIPKDFLKAKFLLYYLRWYKVPSLGYSRHYKLLKEINLPIPPLSEQQRIVSELDLLSGIIEKKKAQLKEYDQLAQSIFFDMFGDPVTNEKGWERQPFYSICKSLFAGGDVPKENFSKTKTEKYKVPIISNGINDKAIYGYTNIAKVEEESLTISGRGTIGYCAIRKEPFFPVIRLIIATPKQDIILPIVLKYIIDSLNLKGEGVAIPQLTIPKVKNELIILPPLFLQQQFAEKTEAIEKQKELIMQSLTEMESLFNSRMDFWLNY